ncbi:MAG: sugar phosphate nucleotidyltransferase, partial [Ktedonobacterales bacterium]
MSRFAAVILAAGKGTRMKSRFPKVTHAVGGRPMLEHVLRAASDTVSTANDTGAESSNDAEDHSPRYVVVLGHERERVQQTVPWTPPDGALRYVTQEPQRGTGDAVRHALAAWQDDPLPRTILVLYGDTPVVRAETLGRLMREHVTSRATLTFLTGIADRPTDYGRVLRDASGRVTGIVEKAHATREELAIPEVNSGIYCFETAWLRTRLNGLEPHDNGEYYLTDLIAVAVAEAQPIATASAPLEETIGVNDRVQLAEAEA